MKRELFYRVITDATQVTVQRDRDYKSHLELLVREFKAIKDYVGKDIENEVVTQLDNLRRYGVKEEKVKWRILLEIYENMNEAVATLQGRGNGQLNSTFWKSLQKIQGLALRLATRAHLI